LSYHLEVNGRRISEYDSIDVAKAAAEPYMGSAFSIRIEHYWSVGDIPHLNSRYYDKDTGDWVLADGAFRAGD
jgi:hypothetical protein